MRKILAIWAGIMLWAGSVGAQQAANEAVAPAKLTLSLQEAIQRVLQEHPDVQSAQAAIRQAQAQARLQQARCWPQINAEMSLAEIQSLARTTNIGGGTITTGGGRRTTRDYALTLDFEIFNSTRDLEIKRAKTLAEASQYGLPEAQRQLAYEVISAAYQLLASKQLARALMQAVAAAERHRDMAEARIQEGVAPQSDLWPVLVEVAETRLQAVQAETSIQTAEAALRALLQLPPGTELELTARLPEAPYSRDLAELLSKARQIRPDIKQQELRVKAAELSTRVARVQSGVQLNARASADYGSHTGATGESWTLRLGATYPVFDAGAAQAAVLSAEASAQQERQRLAALLLNVQEQVERAHVQAKEAYARLEPAAVARRHAETNLAAAEARYREGLAIIIEVIDAQVALLRAQVAEIQARLDYAAALAALDLALGVLPESFSLEN